jgi:hypothetical protein
MRKQWFWCIHCERAFESNVPDDWKFGWFIEEVGRPVMEESGEIWWRCPYEGCDGTPIDFIPWEEMREGDRALPMVPVTGTVYSPKHEGPMGTMIVLEGGE